MSVEFNTKCAVGSEEIPVKLYYTEDDPACVYFQFFNVGSKNTSPEWVFARDLIKQALEDGLSGDGDVKVETADDTCVMFWFTSPEGTALATFELEIIEEFMEFVYDEVPEGEDHYEIPDGVPEDWLV